MTGCDLAEIQGGYSIFPTVYGALLPFFFFILHKHRYRLLYVELITCPWVSFLKKRQ